jgi:hypothetical protein
MQSYYFTCGSLCQPVANDMNQGGAFLSVDDCVRECGYKIPKKYCGSTRCEPVGINYQKPASNDICTSNRHTCLHANKHQHGFRFHFNIE